MGPRGTVSGWWARVGGAVIAAAFLGPGTVTTAARAGSGHGLTLLWALVFATVACYVLQEASARLTITSGRTLGEALRRHFDHGLGAWLVLVVILGAILLGCAAYEAGNILGGVAGARLAVDLSPQILTVLCGVSAALLLGFGSSRQVVLVLSLLVAMMGAGFLATAIVLAPPLSQLVSGLVWPHLPDGSGLLVIGLVGTTVVPYNLFLGSGLAQGQELRHTRQGLAVAIGLGGLISMAVVVVGSAVGGDFSFESLAEVLASELGPWAPACFALGLFAAGFSSAITAPLAAALTARSLFHKGSEDLRWADGAWRYRLVWLAVLGAGVTFGLLEVRPVPAIIAAQALNGILLPWVALFLFLVMNDRQQLGDAANGPGQNLALGAVVVIAVLLGVRGVISAVTNLLDRPSLLSTASVVALSAVVLAVTGLWLVAKLKSGRPGI